MKTYPLITLIWLILSCSPLENEEAYSKEFLEYYQKGNIQLQADSLVFPEEAQLPASHIPTMLALNTPYTFIDKENEQELILTRVNYTALDFELTSGNHSCRGRASLNPTFYLGTESIETSEGGFWIFKYSVMESLENCLYQIGVGNECYSSSDLSTKPYVFLYKSKHCTSQDMVFTGELMWSE